MTFDLLASAHDIVEQLFTPPSAGRMSLIKWVLNLTYLVHLPYLGLLVAGTTLSLLLNVLHKQDGGKNHLRMAKDLLDLVAPNRPVGFMLGVFPIIALLTCYGQIVHTGSIFSYYVWLAVIVLAALGVLGVFLHKEQWEMREGRWLPHFALGAGGLAMLLPATLLLFANVILASTPERWPLVNDPTDVLFTWDIVWRFGQWSALSWAFLGAGILFFFHGWGDRRAAMDDSYAAFTRNIGVGIGLAFILQVPVAILLELYNKTNPYFHGGYMFGGTVTLLPAAAAFDASIVAVVGCMLVGHLLYKMISEKSARFGAHVFVLLIAVYGAWIIGGQLQLGAALQEHEIALAAKATEEEKKIKAELAVKEETDPAKRLQIGEKIFMASCTNCHVADMVTKSNGPGLLKRLPRYKGTGRDLAKWIREGKKTDAPDSPEYQAMTGQDIRGHNMTYLIEYLMKRLEEGK